MFITLGIVTSIAIAGYLGYKNRDNVLWNSIKLYDSIKDYCSQFQDTFILDKIVVYNGIDYFNIDSLNFMNIPFYLSGICNKKSPEYINSKIGLSYTLNNHKYCKIYFLYPDNEEAEIMIHDIDKLKKYNKNSDANCINNIETQKESHVNYILSATYFDGFEEIDVTDLLHTFDIDGKFYKNNDKITFDDMLEWCNKLNLGKLYNNKCGWSRRGDNRYVEIINLFGDILSFSPNHILKIE
jgi:hypothetical protein